MTKKKTVTVSSGDATLAHSIVKQAIKIATPKGAVTSTQTGASVHACNLSAKNFMKEIHRLYQDHVVCGCTVDARYKHRKAWVIVLTNIEIENKTALGAALLELDGNVMRFHPLDIIVTPHALARILQRSLHTNDTRLAVRMVAKRLMVLATKVNETRIVGDFHFRLYGGGGCLAGSREKGGLIIKTWFDFATDTTELANKKDYTLMVLDSL